MARARPLLALWLVTGLVLAVIVVPMWTPLRRGLACYRMHAEGERAQAEVVERLEGGLLLLRYTSGSAAGEPCTVGSTGDLHRTAKAGDVLDVVFRPERHDTATLVATLRNSLVVLVVVGLGLGGLALLVLGAAAFVHSSLTRRPVPRRLVPVPAEELACPVCGQAMEEGYLPLLGGVHWREPGAAIGLPHTLGGLPGTAGWRGRQVVHAFRCTGCEICLFQYGRNTARAA